MNSTQFAWAYLLKMGMAGVKPSYYGGYDPVEKDWEKKFGSAWDYKSFEKAKTAYIEQVKKVGVDWDKTRAPESDMVSRFTDTFHDPEQQEMLRGTLVLKDGTKQEWVSEAVEVPSIFKMMEDANKIASEFEYLK